MTNHNTGQDKRSKEAGKTGILLRLTKKIIKQVRF